MEIEKKKKEKWLENIDAHRKRTMYFDKRNQ